MIECQYCHGTGLVADHVQDDGHECPACKGTGVPTAVALETKRVYTQAEMDAVHNVAEESGYHRAMAEVERHVIGTELMSSEFHTTGVIVRAYERERAKALRWAAHQLDDGLVTGTLAAIAHWLVTEADKASPAIGKLLRDREAAAYRRCEKLLDETRHSDLSCAQAANIYAKWALEGFLWMISVGVWLCAHALFEIKEMLRQARKNEQRPVRHESTQIKWCYGLYLDSFFGSCWRIFTTAGEVVCNVRY